MSLTLARTVARPTPFAAFTFVVALAAGCTSSSDGTCCGDSDAVSDSDTTAGDTDAWDPGVDAPDCCNRLAVPPLLTGTDFNLTLGESSKQLRSGAATKTYGYNGADFWGPTLVFQHGDTVNLHVTNDLMEETTTHWHGMHLPAAADGGPHQVIAAGDTWSPSFEVKNHAGTYWYHPHLHMMTQEQLTYGAGGLILVRDAEESALALPRTYGVDDVPLVLTSRRFDSDNQFNTTTAYGDYVLANGTMDSWVPLPEQMVRLRVLNAETERAYNLGFPDNRTFWVIATDGGLVDAPIPVTRVLMSPGERVEIVLDLSSDTVGTELELQSFNKGQPFGFPGGEPGTTGDFGSLLNDVVFTVLHIVVGEPTSAPITELPAKLTANTFWKDSDVTHSRTLNITDNGPGTPFTFDGVSFDEGTVNQTIQLNAIEKWTVSNGRTFSHSFHIHDVQFKLVSRSSGPVEDYEQGWKDTVYVPRNESVTFIAKFEDYASDTDAYMYHCHMANHEDGGLMGQFLVVP